jgi:uncharacterized protein (UPF0303 family)
MTDRLDLLLEQENTLQFTRFDSQTAWRLGSYLVQRSKKDNLGIVVDISLSGHCLFHYSANGTSLDNDTWIARKIRTVLRFGHASYYMGCKLALEGTSGAARYYLDERDYCFHGGGFPIILKGTGVIGSLAVSGLKQEQDHDLAVQALAYILRKPQDSIAHTS